MSLLRRSLVIRLLFPLLDLAPERIFFVLCGRRFLGLGGRRGGGGGGWAFGDGAGGGGCGDGGGGFGGLGFLLFDAAGFGAFELETAAYGGGVVVASHGGVGGERGMLRVEAM